MHHRHTVTVDSVSIRARRALWALALTGVLCSCSVQQYALNRAADSLAGSVGSFGRDDDPELIAQAAPFGLKLMDSVLEESPAHLGLLTAAAKNYVQYSYAFVQQNAEALEDTDVARANAQLQRARGLYARARAYALRGLEVAHPGMTAALSKDPRDALKRTTREDVPILYWSAVATGAWVSLSKDNPAAVAQLPALEALIDRALELNESWDAGAVHTFLIGFEGSRAQRGKDPNAVARKHFERAVALSDGMHAAPYVAMAESVAVSVQDRMQFEQLLQQALAIDVNARPQWRLANTVMQRRARWLLSRTEQLFAQ
jgi:predicted anti-sigma-YlaC factor YlaD